MDEIDSTAGKRASKKTPKIIAGLHCHAAAMVDIDKTVGGCDAWCSEEVKRTEGARRGLVVINRSAEE